jgi:outer membrane protein TolC
MLARHRAASASTAHYAVGLVTYLNVLVADTQYHQALINDVAATAQRHEDTFALYLTLSAGWWNVSPAVTAL